MVRAMPFKNGKGEMKFYKFSRHLIQKMAFSRPTPIQKNDISRPPYKKWHFETPIQKMAFLRPPCKKWHFRNPHTKNDIFEIPLTTYFSVLTPLYKNGQNLNPPYKNGQNLTRSKNPKIWPPIQKMPRFGQKLPKFDPHTKNGQNLTPIQK